MLNHDDFIAKIDAYLDHNLSADDLVLFEQTLQANPTLKKEIAAQRLVRKSLQRTGQAEMRQLFKQFQAELQTENSPLVDENGTKGKVKQLHTEQKRRYALLAVAASIAIFIGIGVVFWFTDKPEQATFAQNLSTHKIEYIEQNGETMGYAGTGSEGKDYKTLLFSKSETYDKPHYEFVHRDTILLFSNSLSPAKDNLQLVYDSQQNKYFLRINGKPHEVEQGFKGVKELK